MLKPSSPPILTRELEISPEPASVVAASWAAADDLDKGSFGGGGIAPNHFTSGDETGALPLVEMERGWKEECNVMS